MKIALVGATGLVGGVMRKVLVERGFADCEFIPAASSKSVGKKLMFGDREVTVVSVDVPRKRIALSARTRPAATAIAGRSGHDNAKPRSYASSGFSINPFANL